MHVLCGQLSRLGSVCADLKPSNVLLVSSRKDRRGFVAKVSDFGQSQVGSQVLEHAAVGRRQPAHLSTSLMVVAA